MGAFFNPQLVEPPKNDAAGELIRADVIERLLEQEVEAGLALAPPHPPSPHTHGCVNRVCACIHTNVRTYAYAYIHIHLRFHAQIHNI